MILDPRIIEMRRRAPVSTIPYAGQHNSFKCTGCNGFFNRALRLKNGKLNVCPSCKEARVAKAVEVQ
ncbi:hypothetical protein [Cupriavidus numazuensis]|uniref:Zinc ribbon domain-containing protein n=1 Tax=Cupriavidus numazuensis TaxID=221992 RepID=A0ABN7PSM9_9BURK|nr:hypothetical protein [Cupriavidus numazuensis]CAG2132321.1 hypothetical protein LMG26411_00596 [Cupriavidus numazuensis]